MGYASGKQIQLKEKLNSADTSLVADIDVGVTTGRLYFVNDDNEEWIDFTGVAASGSNFSYTGLTRGLSQTANPATAGTGNTWLAGNIGILTAMHDQLIDNNQFNQLKQEGLTYATEAARDAALGADGAATKAYTDIWITGTGLFYNYNLSTNQWESIDTGTVTPNASTIVAGKVEISTDAQVTAGDETGETGAILGVTPTQLKKSISLQNAISTIDDTDYITIDNGGENKKVLYSEFKVLSGVFGGDGSDGALSISSGTTTLTMVNDFVVKNYTSVDISGTAILDIVPSGDNGGVCYIKCVGDFTISAGTIDGTAAGGIVANNGMDFLGDYTLANASSSTVAGLGKNLLGTIVGKQIRAINGGGSAVPGVGAGSASNTTGNGNIGATILVVEVGGALNFTGGTINCNGLNGSTGISVFGGGAGGGGGSGAGSVIIIYNTLTANTGTISVNGGNGADGGLNAGGSGDRPGGFGSGGAGSVGAGGAGGLGGISTGDINGQPGTAGESTLWGTGGTGGVGQVGVADIGGGGGGGGGGAGVALVVKNTEF